MRTTVTLDDELLAQASEAMGTAERSVLLHEGLRLIVQREAARRLAALGGMAPGLRLPPRRRRLPHRPWRRPAAPDSRTKPPMLLVDTSVWSDHLRRHDAALARRLEAGDVLVHPFVVGELACGKFPHRARALALLNVLPGAPVLGQAELLAFIERHALAGQGVGFVDIHLIASALVSHAGLWTRDRRLSQAAAALGLATVTGRH